MIRRVNSTGRKRIPQSLISAIILDGQPRTFHARINLEGQGLPVNARVVLDAISAGSELVQRFDFGEVGHITPPPELVFEENMGENIRFTLKVIDVSSKIGRLLGVAENIKPENAGNKIPKGRQGILPIEPSDQLGELLWRLNFTNKEVFLLVNKKVDGLVERFRNDALLCGLVYPAIIRQIFLRAFHNEEPDDENGWQAVWFRFAKQFTSDPHPTGNDRDDEEIDEWISKVINGFCNHFKFVDKSLNQIRGE